MKDLVLRLTWKGSSSSREMLAGDLEGQLARTAL